MLLPDLEEFHRAKMDLLRTITDLGETESARSAEAVLRTLESALRKRIEADIWGTTDALYRVNKMLVADKCHLEVTGRSSG